MKKIFAIVAVLTVLALVASIAPAQTPPGATTSAPLSDAAFCSGLFPTTGTTAGIPSGLIGTAVLIMLVMSAIMGMIYGLGYAFKISRLTQFSKIEFGEMAVTFILIGVFIGSISATSPSGLLHIGPSTVSSTFIGSCQVLSTNAISLFNNLMTYYLPATQVLSLFKNFKVELTPVEFGFTFNPFVGYTLESHAINELFGFSTLMIMIFLGLVIFLGVIYNLFPLFLYLGIVLRTVPFTRAAGGAFIGLFVGFYIFFPFMFYALASSIPTTAQFFSYNGFTSALSAISSATGVSSIISFFTSLLTTVLNPFGIVNYLIENTVVPFFYILMSLILSLMLSFEFAQLIGGFLGAPNLNSTNTLRKII